MLSSRAAKSPHLYSMRRIYTDSQAAVRTVDHPRRQSGQIIVKNLLNCINEAVDIHPRLQIEILWIPGHSNIGGNECADAEAKKAALDHALGKRFGHMALKSAWQRHIK